MPQKTTSDDDWSVSKASFTITESSQRCLSAPCSWNQTHQPSHAASQLLETTVIHALATLETPPQPLATLETPPKTLATPHHGLVCTRWLVGVRAWTLPAAWVKNETDRKGDNSTTSHHHCTHIVSVSFVLCIFCVHVFVLVQMYICIYVYMYICIYVFMYLCIYVFRYLCIYVFMYLCIYVYLYICLYVYLYICMNIFLLMYICNYLFICKMYICIFVYMYNVNMYIYIYMYVYVFVCVFVHVFVYFP